MGNILIMVKKNKDGESRNIKLPYICLGIQYPKNRPWDLELDNIEIGKLPLQEPLHDLGE